MARWQAPANIDRFSVEHQQFEVTEVEYLDKTGVVLKTRGVDVPDGLAVHMRQLGFTPLAIPPEVEVKAEADTSKALPNNVAAEASAVAAQAAELKEMTSDAILKWLVTNGVDVSKLPNRPLRLQAALEHLGYVEPQE